MSAKAGTIAGGFALLAVLLLTTRPAAAQAPIQSFADLAPLVKPGDEVVVQGRDGRKTRGRVVMVGGDTLEIRRPPRFFGADRQDVFPEASVSHVELRDSTTVYGGLLGFAVGLAVAVTVAKTATCEDLCELGPVVAAPLLGPVIGAVIDGRFNRLLYISPAAAKRISVAPAFRPTRAGISASISF